jgi:predicted nucleic acid-binding protein
VIVADANLIAYLLIAGEKTGLAEETFRTDPEWAVPLICRSEVRNILVLYMRHEGMSLAQAKQTMELAENLWRSREYAVPSDDVLDLAAGHKITAYDAEFVVLARELDVPLVTFDKPLQRAFPKVAIAPEKFVRA